MALFVSLLILLLLAILLLQAARRLSIPYPTMLAVAGVAVASLPQAPAIEMDPRLVMAVFIAPALLDAAYDFPLRAIRTYWMPLIALAVMAVVITTIAVAWLGVAAAGLPVSASIVLGAIVSPPDAAATEAVFKKMQLPRSTVTVLRGESLLNDAVALMIFSAALGIATQEHSLDGLFPGLLLAVPGGVALGMILGRISVLVQPFLAGTFGGILFQFVATFLTWLIADALHLSAILAVVAAAMTVAQTVAHRQRASDRLHSLSIWGVTVFVLNVLAFLLIGLEARNIVLALSDSELLHAFAFAGEVLATVIGVRVLWVLLYNRLAQPLYRWLGRADAPTFAQGIIASWCGMRGLVTLATALALPSTFPGRSLIVLSALAVVLGTLVLQGLTVGPLIRLLGFQRDKSLAEATARARILLLDVAVTLLKDRKEPIAGALLACYEGERADAGKVSSSEPTIDELRRETIAARRNALLAMWRNGEIDDEVFQALEQELDLAQVAASPAKEFALVDD